MKKLMLFAGFLCLQPILYANSFIPSDKIPTDKTRNSPVNASEREQTHFKTHFTDARDAVWYNVGTENAYCMYHSGDITNRVFYDAQGYWQYTLKSYLPAFLNSNVKDLVSYHFGNYEISYVNEIMSDGNDSVYVINLENSNSIKVIQVTGDNILVRQALNK